MIPARLKKINLACAALAAAALLAACAHKPAPKAGISGIFHSPLGRIVETITAAKEKIPGRKIVVYGLPDISGRAAPEGELIAERLTTRLARTGEFHVIERSRLDAVLKELNLASAGIIDPQTAARAGRVLGAEAVVTGTLTRLDGKFEINARLIDTQTGAILAAATEQLDENDLRIAEARQRPVTYPRGENAVLLSERRELPAAGLTEPPKGWEAWPGWENRYGNFALEGGKLVYRLASMQQDHIDTPDGGYYPAALLSRRISGTDWSLDAKVTYNMPQASGRWFSLFLWFGREGVRPSAGGAGRLFVFGTFRRADAGYNLDSLQFQCSPCAEKDVNLPAGFPFIRLQRKGRALKALVSRDGRTFTEAFSATLGGTAAAAPQKLVIGGQAMNAAGSYAEYEYIKLNGKPLF